MLTVGHSTREQEDLIALLKAHGVKRLVDVRAIPRSRHNPQFNREQIGPALRRAGIGYLHMPAMGGLRHAQPSSLNTNKVKHVIVIVQETIPSITILGPSPTPRAARIMLTSAAAAKATTTAWTA